MQKQCKVHIRKNPFMHKLEGWEMWVTSLVVKLCCQNSWKRSPLFSSGSVRRKAQGHPSVWDIFFNSKRTSPGKGGPVQKHAPIHTCSNFLQNETTGSRLPFSLSSHHQKIEQKGGKLENLIQFSKFSWVSRFVIVFTSAVDFGGKTGNLQCLKIT